MGKGKKAGKSKGKTVLDLNAFKATMGADAGNSELIVDQGNPNDWASYGMDEDEVEKKVIIVNKVARHQRENYDASRLPENPPYYVRFGPVPYA